MICENFTRSSQQNSTTKTDPFSAAESLNAVKLYTTEYYEMLLLVTISTVEREKWQKKQNNIKIKESSIALLEQFIPIIFQDISISSRRHPHSAKDLNKQKRKIQRGGEHPFDIHTTLTSVCFFPGYANGYRDSLFAFLLRCQSRKTKQPNLKSVLDIELACKQLD